MSFFPNHAVLKTLLLALLLATFACDKNTFRQLPPQLNGTWTTDDPRYHDRFFELSPAFVIVVTGPGDQPSVQSVDKVKTDLSDSDTTFTVDSFDRSQKTAYQMVFRFSQANGGEIRFRNQKAVWRRRADTGESH